MINVDFLKSNYIAGSFFDGKLESQLDILHKYTGETLATLTLANDAQIQQALQSSLTGFAQLKKMSAGARAEGLLQLAKLIDEHKEILTDIIICEAGKPREYAATEVQRSIATLESSAHEAIRFCGEVVNLDHHNGVGRQGMTRRVPRGPIAAISPFNFPLNLALHKIAPAIAVGCSIILKPSKRTPLTSLYLAFLMQQTNLPKDSLNILVCDRAQAQQLITSDITTMISFTGSDAIGWNIKSQAPKKPAALELGGNAAVVVDQDTDIKMIAQKLIPGAFLYAGQICISTQRVYVHKSCYADLLTALKKELALFKIGDPNEKTTLMGPLIDAKAFEKIQDMVQAALKDGAEIVCQSQPVENGKNMFPATILTNTKPESAVIQDEAFGPICVVEPVQNITEAIQAVNYSRYGLQAGVFTNNIHIMKQCFAELEVGGVIINDIPGFRVDSMPYGGVKDSGLGREGPIYAMQEMTEPRLLVF